VLVLAVMVHMLKYAQMGAHPPHRGLQGLDVRFRRFAAPCHVEHEHRGVAIRGNQRSGTHPVIGEEALRLHDLRSQRLDGRAQGVHKRPKDRILDGHLVRADQDHFGGVMHVAPELRDQLRGHLGLGHSGELFLRANGGFEQGGDEEQRERRGQEPHPDGSPGVRHTEAQGPGHRNMRKNLHQSGPSRGLEMASAMQHLYWNQRD
jgi:hypothetical protein